MAIFQFQCPQGHLLEGDDTQAGQTCTCPTCGMLFIIPAPVAPVYASEPQAGYEGPAEPEATPFAGFGGGHSGPAVEAGPVLLHIPCPNGHELETPLDMLNQDVLCPHCNAQFCLLEKNSVEYKSKRQAEQERKDFRAGKLWLNWAIAIAVLVVIGLIVMIAVNSGH